MNELLPMLRAHLARYPEMEPIDLIKLLYQSTFGCAHLLQDPERARQQIEQELTETAPDPNAEAAEDIGFGFLRVHLAALKREETAAELLWQAVVQTANRPAGTMTEFLLRLEKLRALARSGAIPNLDPAALERELEGYRKRGCPPVSHSMRYRQRYCPAYRVVHREIYQKIYGLAK